MSTQAEQETVVRWDRETGQVTAWTADPMEAVRWRRKGWPVVVYGRERDGQPRSWESSVPRRCIRYAPPEKSKSRVEAGRLNRQKRGSALSRQLIAAIGDSNATD